MLASEGQRDRALERTHRALGIAPEDPAFIVNAAFAYARLGMKEEALACLEETFAKGIGKGHWVEQGSRLRPASPTGKAFVAGWRAHRQTKF